VTTAHRFHFAVGDRVGTRTRRGVINGTVVKIGRVLLEVRLDTPIEFPEVGLTETLWRYDSDLFAPEETP
jgi:hypothetical protein